MRCYQKCVLRAAEVFKVCLDYWNKFVPDVFTTVHQFRGGTDPITAAMFTTTPGASPMLQHSEAYFSS